MMRSQILCVLLFISWSAAQENPSVNNTNSVSNMSAVTMTTNEATTSKQTTTNRNTPLLTTPQPTLLWSFLNMECRNQLIVCGGLILACSFFLMTTLVLACKVCQLNRRIRMLIHHDVELVNSSKYSVENSKSDKITSKEEAKETTSLMADQANQEAVAIATKENGGKDEDGPKTEENEEEGASKSEQASAEDAAESSSFPKPPDEILYPEAAAAAASSSSEGVTEEPNNQPQKSE